MSFRRRMVLLAAGAVAAAIVIASVVVYVVIGNELRGKIDTSLRQKLTPGPQAVQILYHLSPAAVAKLHREGKLAPPGFPQIAFGYPQTGKAHSSGRRSVRSGEGPGGETVSIEGNVAF
ncbi:MAG TPA: hypothetical protein VGF15_00880, partial [Solirubrobacteraceae bacterium]